MLLRFADFTLRPLLPEDAESLAREGNNHNVWRNLRDRFPHPLTVSDTRAYITNALGQSPTTTFAIDVDGQAVGVIGLTLCEGERRHSAELSYWLGEPYWGRGIITQAVQAVTEYAIKELGLSRIESYVFSWNPASARVLEKMGFEREGILRNSIIKDGVLLDRWLYAYLAGQGDS
ncbi:MAG: GNAT family N-acetyltransferase [Bythopirellula sp.]|nr:GNAT family N-acetyltransferase [Bythopirellula sp.]